MAKEHMHTFRSLRILPIAVMTVILLLTAAACRRTPQRAIDAMDRAEALMEEHPDSALAVMQTVDTADLHGAADRARHALLMSMALDKNYIDPTDFRILQPAIDYYERHGSPDQRLKTRYYQGRIFMNQGNDDAALAALLRAAEDSASCTDSLALARVLVAQATLYYKQFNIQQFTRLNLQAEKLLSAVGDTLNAVRLLAKSLNGYTILDEPEAARNVYKHLKALGDKSSEYYSLSVGALLAYLNEFGDAVSVETELKKCDSLSAGDAEVMLTMAQSYVQLGYSEKARGLLNSIDKKAIHAMDSIRYFSILSDLASLESDYHSALDTYKRYSYALAAKNEQLLRSDLIFTERKHEMEKAYIIEMAQKRIWILSALLACAILAIIGLLIYWRLRLSKKENQNITQMNLILQRDKENLVDNVHNLEDEKQSLKDDNLRIRSQLSNTIETTDQLQRQISELQEQCDNLAHSLKNAGGISETEKENILDKLRLLNMGIITEAVSNERDAQKYKLRINEVVKDITQILDFNRMAFNMLFPKFISELEKKNLTDFDISQVCLHLLGFNTRQIGEFLNINRTYHSNITLRQKLGLKDGSVHLHKYILSLLNESERSI